MKYVIMLGVLGLLLAGTKRDLIAATTQATQGTVNGVVTDANGKAVAKVKVRIKKVAVHAPIGQDADPHKPVQGLTVATLTTDKDGKFSTTLAAGSYWAESGSKTLGYDKEEFDVKAGESVDVKMKLEKN